MHVHQGQPKQIRPTAHATACTKPPRLAPHPGAVSPFPSSRLSPRAHGESRDGSSYPRFRATYPSFIEGVVEGGVEARSSRASQDVTPFPPHRWNNSQALVAPTRTENTMTLDWHTWQNLKLLPLVYMKGLTSPPRNLQPAVLTTV
jgi:hypothetical protein